MDAVAPRGQDVVLGKCCRPDRTSCKTGGNGRQAASSRRMTTAYAAPVAAGPVAINASCCAALQRATAPKCRFVQSCGSCPMHDASTALMGSCVSGAQRQVGWSDDRARARLLTTA